MYTLTNRIPYFVFAILVFLADQLSKWSVTEHMIRPVNGESPLTLTEWLLNAPDPLPYTEIYVLPFFNLVMVWNKGISFGLFNDTADYGPLILTVLAGIIVLWFVIWLAAVQSRTQAFAIALVIGGALGNMLDRIRFKAVVDFLDFHLFGFHWPAFNISDSAIVVGVFLLIIYSLFFEKRFHP